MPDPANSSDPKKTFTSSDRGALVDAARACLQNHDYAQAAELLRNVPGSFRDDDVQDLLKQSTDLQDEVDFLVADMDEAVRLKEYEGLEANVKRLLELKPGYKPARQLLEELNTYGSGDGRGRVGDGPTRYNKDEGIVRPLLLGGVFAALLFGATWFAVTVYLKTTDGAIAEELVVNDDTGAAEQNPSDPTEAEAEVGSAVAASIGTTAAETVGVQLLSPDAGAVLDNGRSDRSDPVEWVFDWSDVPGATRYNIHVIAGTATIPMIDAETEESAYVHLGLSSYIIDRNRTGWTWKVRAMVDGEWSEWSEVREFDVEPLNTD